MHLVDEDQRLSDRYPRTTPFGRQLLVFDKLVDQLLGFAQVHTVEENIVLTEEFLADRTREAALANACRADKQLVREPLFRRQAEVNIVDQLSYRLLLADQAQNV